MNKTFITKIILNSSSEITLKLYVKFLTKMLEKCNFKKLKYYNMYRLPTMIKRITLLKSPHKFKRAKEHFEIRKHKMIISLESSLDSDILKYVLINKPKNVSFKII